MATLRGVRGAGLLAGMVVAALVPVRAGAAETYTIGIIDSGISPSHPEFRPGQVVAWKDFVAGGSAPYDDRGHGTAVASRAAGATLGAYPGAGLVVAKVLDSDNTTPWGRVGSAIKWAVDAGADVINVSIWSPLPSPTSHLFALQTALNYATAHDVLVVWIAGNGTAPPSSVLPGAASSQALVVGASTSTGSPALFSQVDPEALAWGQDVRVAWNDGGIYTRNGTSFAAPWVAGAAAKVLAEGAPRDPDWLKWVLLHSARDSPVWTYPQEGYGVLDSEALAKAVAVAKGLAPVPPIDSRDAFHLVSTGVRTAESGAPPVGALPPA